MDFRAARDRSFLGDGGSHRCPQGSSGCDGQLLDLCVQTSDHPLHRLATLRTDNHNQPERIILLHIRLCVNAFICEPFERNGHNRVVCDLGLLFCFANVFYLYFFRTFILTVLRMLVYLSL